MRIGIDLDNVVYPFCDVFLRFVRDEYPLPDGDTYSEPTTWEFYKEWGWSTADFEAAMRHAFDKSVLFYQGRPTPESANAINHYLSDHEIVIVTHRPKYARLATKWWLYDSQILLDELHFAEDKTKFDLDVLLDDAPHNIEQAQAAGIRAIIWDQPWNRHVKGERVYAWDQFVNAINEGPMDPAYWPAEAEAVMNPLDFPPLPTLAQMVGETRIVDPVTGGAKGQKPSRLELLPYDVLAKVAEHYGKGAEKYEARNWERGYAYSLSMGALMRHLGAWWQGEDIDAETGSSHLHAVIFHAFSLAAFELRGIGTDDRPHSARPVRLDLGLRSTNA